VQLARIAAAMTLSALVDCAATNEITTLHVALLQACGQTDDRPFQPHVTLAQIRYDGPAVARRHPIDQKLSLT